MWKNYFKTAWRNLWKNKIFSAINIIGLAIGMAACLLILQYVSFELSFDQFNKNAADIYRVYNDRYQNGKLIQHGTITYSAISKAMQNDYPEVINHTRVEPITNEIITCNDKKLSGQNLLAVDNSFLSMFSYSLVAGDEKTALKDPNNIVLTEKLARKLFDVRDNNFQPVLNKVLVIERDSLPYKVTGVCKDVPENSHLSFDLLLSYVSLFSGGNANWKESDYDFTDSDFWHYIQLKHGTNYKKLEAKFPAFSQKYFNGNKVSGSDEKFYLQPLKKAHLYSDFEYEIGNTGSATVVWGLLIIAVLIIFIAWINYINLTTAKSMERAKEVGMRKVAGATRQQLIGQFLSESFFINIIALMLAIVFVLVLQNPFNKLVQHDLSISFLFVKGLSGYSITIAWLVLIVAGILFSGFYPSFVLSAFKPILVLKGKFTSSFKGIVLRKVLVIGQFAITVALIIGSFVVYRQLKYVNAQNLGINISQVLVIRPPELTKWDSTFIGRVNSFTDQITQLSHVRAATTSWNVPGGETGRSFHVRRADQDSTVKYTMRHNGVSLGYNRLYQTKILAGRDFASTDFNPNFNKLHSIILNESATKLLGFSSPEDAIGKTIIRGKKWDVIGVINDYHQKSLRFPLEPTLLMPIYGTGSFISVRVDPNDLPSTIAAIKKNYDNFFAGNVFDYFFLDDHFNEQYKSDRLFGKVFAIFAAFAIFIACLGLLGLSLFATMQRTKEIGVRKVLGASISNIVVLLSKDFIKLVIIAFLIASPVAWYVMHRWLQDFAYRIHINWWIFFGAGLLALIIAMGTISFQAIKAAIANPVKSLRSE